MRSSAAHVDGHRTRLPRGVRSRGRRAHATLRRHRRRRGGRAGCVSPRRSSAGRRRALPPSPAGWIITTARNRAIDRHRRTRSHDGARRRMQHCYITARTSRRGGVVRDDQLRLIFTCCHPALAINAQVALTLRLLGGLTTAEIARAFLVPESTMAQRLVRAKGKIRDARNSRTAFPRDGSSRPAGRVLAVVYLLFNEGYAASSGERLIREDLCRRRFDSDGCWMSSCPIEPEVDGAARAHAARRVAARRADRLDGRWCCSRIRIAVSGIAQLIAEGHGCRGNVSSAISPARISSRRRSTRSTATRRRWLTRIGARSCSCMTCISRLRQVRSLRFTVRSRWPKSTDRCTRLALVETLDLQRLSPVPCDTCGSPAAARAHRRRRSGVRVGDCACRQCLGTRLPRGAVTRHTLARSIHFIRVESVPAQISPASVTSG